MEITSENIEFSVFFNRKRLSIYYTERNVRRIPYEEEAVVPGEEVQKSLGDVALIQHK